MARSSTGVDTRLSTERSGIVTLSGYHLLNIGWRRSPKEVPESAVAPRLAAKGHARLACASSKAESGGGRGGTRDSAEPHPMGEAWSEDYSTHRELVGLRAGT